MSLADVPEGPNTSWEYGRLETPTSGRGGRFSPAPPPKQLPQLVRPVAGAAHCSEAAAGGGVVPRRLLQWPQVRHKARPAPDGGERTVFTAEKRQQERERRRHEQQRNERMQQQLKALRAAAASVLSAATDGAASTEPAADPLPPLPLKPAAVGGGSPARLRPRSPIPPPPGGGAIAAGTLLDIVLRSPLISLPSSTVPPEYHKTSRTPVLGGNERTMRPEFDHAQGLCGGWVIRQFPSAFPTARVEVFDLAGVLDDMLAKAGDRGGTSTPDSGKSAERIEAEWQVWDLGLRELVRQVAAACAERGTLLQQVQKGLNRLWTSMTALLRESDRRCDELVEALEVAELRLEEADSSGEGSDDDRGNAVHSGLQTSGGTGGGGGTRRRSRRSVNVGSAPSAAEDMAHQALAAATAARKCAAEAPVWLLQSKEEDPYKRNWKETLGMEGDKQPQNQQLLEWIADSQAREVVTHGALVDDVARAEEVLHFQSPSAEMIAAGMVNPPETGVLDQALSSGPLKRDQDAPPGSAPFTGLAAAQPSGRMIPFSPCRTGDGKGSAPERLQSRSLSQSLRPRSGRGSASGQPTDYGVLDALSEAETSTRHPTLARQPNDAVLSASVSGRRESGGSRRSSGGRPSAAHSPRGSVHDAGPGRRPSGRAVGPSHSLNGCAASPQRSVSPRFPDQSPNDPVRPRRGDAESLGRRPSTLAEQLSRHSSQAALERTQAQAGGSAGGGGYRISQGMPVSLVTSTHRPRPEVAEIGVQCDIAAMTPGLLPPAGAGGQVGIKEGSGLLSAPGPSLSPTHVDEDLPPRTLSVPEVGQVASPDAGGGAPPRSPEEMATGEFRANSFAAGDLEDEPGRLTPGWRQTPREELIPTAASGAEVKAARTASKRASAGQQRTRAQPHARTPGEVALAPDPPQGQGQAAGRRRGTSLLGRPPDLGRRSSVNVSLLGGLSDELEQLLATGASAARPRSVKWLNTHILETYDHLWKRLQEGSLQLDSASTESAGLAGATFTFFLNRYGLRKMAEGYFVDFVTAGRRHLLDAGKVKPAVEPSADRRQSGQSNPALVRISTWARWAKLELHFELQPSEGYGQGSLAYFLHALAFVRSFPDASAGPSKDLEDGTRMVGAALIQLMHESSWGKLHPDIAAGATAAVEEAIAEKSRASGEPATGLTVDELLAVWLSQYDAVARAVRERDPRQARPVLRDVIWLLGRKTARSLEDRKEQTQDDGEYEPAQWAHVFGAAAHGVGRRASSEVIPIAPV